MSKKNKAPIFVPLTNNTIRKPFTIFCFCKNFAIFKPQSLPALQLSVFLMPFSLQLARWEMLMMSY